MIRLAILAGLAAAIPTAAPAQPADPHAGHATPSSPAPDPHAGHAMPAPSGVDPHAGHEAPASDPHAGHAMPAPTRADPHAGHALSAPTADPHHDHGQTGLQLPVGDAPAPPTPGDWLADQVHGATAMTPARETLRAEHEEQAGWLASEGVDFLLPETINSLREAIAMAQAANTTGLPFVMSLSLIHI